MAAQSRGAWVSASGCYKRRFIPTSLPSGGSTSIPTVRTTPNGKKNPAIAAETLRRAGAMRKERFQVPTSCRGPNTCSGTQGSEYRRITCPAPVTVRRRSAGPQGGLPMKFYAAYGWPWLCWVCSMAWFCLSCLPRGRNRSASFGACFLCASLLRLARLDHREPAPRRPVRAVARYR